MEKISVVNGKLLKWARESCNMPIPFVAEKFGNRLELVIAWEEGTDYPTYAQLETLGSLYKKPLAIFFFPDIPQIRTVKSSYRSLPGNVYDSISYKIIRKINDARIMQINLQELNNGINPAPIVLTKMKYSRDFKITATELRKVFGISIEEQKHRRKDDEALEIWRNCFFNYGIYVFKDAFKDDSISGFCLYDEEFPIIYLNNSMSFSRQIFTLFHEFYHLISNTSGIDKIKDDYFDSLSREQLSLEKICNKFAGEFLVPDDDFSKELKNKDIDEFLVLNLSDRYNVSREVIMRKLLDRKLILKEDYEQKREEYISEAIRAKKEKEKEKDSGGNPYFTRISYLGNGYLHLVFDKYKRNQIDVYQLSEYTKTKIEHLPKLEANWGWRVKI